MRQLIEFIGNGQCCMCGHPITIIEEEKTVITLDQNGEPIGMEIEDYKISGICKNCSEVYYDIEDSAMGFKVANRLKKILPHLQISDNSDKLNPFGYRR